MRGNLNAARGILFGAVLGALIWFTVIILFAVQGQDDTDAGCRNEYHKIVECYRSGGGD